MLEHNKGVFTHSYPALGLPGIFVETFVVGSWMEHLRQLERYTINDRKIQKRVQTFHQAEQKPVARYLLAPE